MQKLSGLVTCWLVPLFILFNIVGWLGLPQREADRSRAPLPRQTYEETADLGTAIGRAWLAGILLGLIVLWFLFTYRDTSSKGHDLPLGAAIVVGAVGLLAGIGRGRLPRDQRFRKAAVVDRRRILAFLVFFAVAISAVCGVLYYDTSNMLGNVIASGYACMLLGYMGGGFWNVGK
jgi:hypothetical protein